MKWRVELYIGGTVFEEIVIARNMNDARKTALARNPTAKVISCTATFNDQLTKGGRVNCPYSEGSSQYPHQRVKDG